MTNFTKPPVQVVDITRHRDVRGTLTAIEKAAGLIPFDPVRTFFISDVPAGASRANHAVNCELFIMVLVGGAVLTEFQGTNQQSWPMTVDQGLLIPSFRYIVVSDIQPSTILAVFASKKFAETSYYTQAEAELL